MQGDYTSERSKSKSQDGLPTLVYELLVKSLPTPFIKKERRMKFLSVKNLKKYQHYKDRDITTWVKVACNIIDDPEMVLMGDSQRWHWVGILILSCRNKNLIPYNCKWISSRISNTRQSRMSESIDLFINLGWLEVKEVSRPMLDKCNHKGLKGLKGLIQPEGKKEPSATDVALQKVYDSGLNIYALINRLRKTAKWERGKNLPDEVILGVCNQYWIDKDSIKNGWAWFIRVFPAEASKWGAQRTQRKAQELKKEISTESLGDIMARLAKTGGKDGV